MQKHFLDYEFPLFVFLTRFVGLGIGPTDECLTAFAKNVANGMEAGDQKAILAGAGGDVDTLIEKVGPPMPPVKTLGYDVIMTRQMSTAIATRIHLRPVQIHHCIVLHQSLLG
mmetsp:Transcript_14760/g.18974  ORF Transcript_14760/g.18974 Transcript_14760/m.18974 type:complete len:113 (-) Transcript_14760:62-400(-)